MTVILETVIKRFIGLSADEKPYVGQVLRNDDGTLYTTTARDLPAGSTFYESDTNRIWRWNGEKWCPPLLTEDDEGLQSETLTEILAHLESQADASRDVNLYAPGGEPFSVARPLSTDRLAYLPSVVTGYEKALDTNSTSASFAALTGSAFPPKRSSTRAVWKVSEVVRPLQAKLGGASYESLLPLLSIVVMPYGGNDNNDIGNWKVVGWNRTPGGQLIPETKCEVQGTLSSTLTGNAGLDVLATEFFCDTLTLTTGTAAIFQGTADIDPAYFRAPITGCEWFEILFDLGTGGDSLNALVRFDT